MSKPTDVHFWVTMFVDLELDLASNSLDSSTTDESTEDACMTEVQFF